MNQNVIPFDREDPEVYVRLLPVFAARRNRRAAMEAHRLAMKREKLLRRISAVCVGLVCAVVVAVIWGVGV